MANLSQSDCYTLAFTRGRPSYGARLLLAAGHQWMDQTAAQAFVRALRARRVPGASGVKVVHAGTGL